jgi:hypothetical protein
VPSTSIYTCTDEYIQPYETSIIPGAKNIGLCEGFVGHFQFFYDPEIYLVMHDALTEPLPGDANNVIEPSPVDPPEEEDGLVDPDSPEGDQPDGAWAPAANGGGCAMGHGTPTEGGAALLALACAVALSRRRKRTSAMRRRG